MVARPARASGSTGSCRPTSTRPGSCSREGVPIEVIDRTMTAWGFPVGPMALLDEVGLDVAQKAGGGDARGVRRADAAGRRRSARMLADGRLGRKNGRGFYLYRDGHKTGVDDAVYDAARRAAGRGRGDRAWSSAGWCTPCSTRRPMACAEGVVRSAARRRHRRDLRHRLPAVPRRPAPHDRRPRRGPGGRRRCTSSRTRTASASGRRRRWPRWPDRAAGTIRPERRHAASLMTARRRSRVCYLASCWSFSV